MPPAGQTAHVPPMDRLRARMTVTDSGCWLVPGNAKTGYAHISVDGRLYLTHRWMYETHVGPIPPGHQIDHLCKTKNCVNPAHLEPVTPQENTRRHHSAKDTCPKGHPYSGVDSRGHRKCAICMRDAKRRYQAKG